MAFAAGVPDRHPALYDTLAGVVVHPLFPVAPEWSLIVAQQADVTGLSHDELKRGIHIGHDLRVVRPLRSGDRIRLTAEIVGVGRLRSGATQDTVFTAVDHHDEIVWRTLFTTLYAGVELEGDPRPVADERERPAPRPRTADIAPLTGTSYVGPLDAHVYSECARIWNPIHTDVAAARRIGLAAPILHGTATLARSVSIAADLVGIDRRHVSGVAGRFRNPVALGSTITVSVVDHDRDRGWIWFETVCADGSPAITHGLITVRPAEQPARTESRR